MGGKEGDLSGKGKKKERLLKEIGGEGKNRHNLSRGMDTKKSGGEEKGAPEGKEKGLRLGGI